MPADALYYPFLAKAEGESTLIVKNSYSCLIGSIENVSILGDQALGIYSTRFMCQWIFQSSTVQQADASSSTNFLTAVQIDWLIYLSKSKTSVLKILWSDSVRKNVRARKQQILECNSCHHVLQCRQFSPNSIAQISVWIFSSFQKINGKGLLLEYMSTMIRATSSSMRLIATASCIG